VKGSGNAFASGVRVANIARLSVVLPELISMRIFTRCLSACLLLFPVTCVAAELPLLLSENFESGSLSRFSATDPDAWKIETVDGSQVAHQFRQSQVVTRVRCPFNRAVIRGTSVGDFQLDVDGQSTARN